jgi:hypothetical protein
MTADTLDPADPQQAAACRRLWAAVALVAIADAEADPLGPAGGYIASTDFRAVLSLADLDADAAVQRIERMRRARLEAARQRQEAELTKGRDHQPRAKRASKGTTR